MSAPAPGHASHLRGQSLRGDGIRVPGQAQQKIFGGRRVAAQEDGVLRAFPGTRHIVRVLCRHRLPLHQLRAAQPAVAGGAAVGQVESCAQRRVQKRFLASCGKTPVLALDADGRHRRSGPSGRPFHLVRVGTRRGSPVEGCALGDRGLRRVHVAGLPGPCAQGRLLQGATVREGHGPRQVGMEIDGVQVGARLLVALSPGKERDSRHRRGHGRSQAAHGGIGHLAYGGARGAVLARHDHAGLEHDAFWQDPLALQLVERHDQRAAGHVEAAVEVVRTVHQYLGLDDRDDVRFLAQRRVARQGVRVGLEAGVARKVAAVDGDDRPPLCEARAEAGILGQALAQPVESFGDLLSRVPGQFLGAAVDLDARDDAEIVQVLRERHPAGGLLAQGLVEQDGAADVIGKPGRGHQHAAVGAAVVLGAFDIDRVEALAAGRVALVHGEDALAGGDHGACGGAEDIGIHEVVGRFRGCIFIVRQGSHSTAWPFASAIEPAITTLRALVPPLTPARSPLVMITWSPSATTPCCFSTSTRSRLRRA